MKIDKYETEEQYQTALEEMRKGALKVKRAGLMPSPHTQGKGIILAIVDFTPQPEIADLGRMHAIELGPEEFGQIFTTWDFQLNVKGVSYAILKAVLDRPVMETFKIEFELPRDFEPLLAILKYKWIALVDKPENWERAFSFEVCGLDDLRTVLVGWAEAYQEEANRNKDNNGYRRKPKAGGK